MARVKPVLLTSIDAYVRKKHYPLWLAVNHHITHKGKRMTFEGHQYLIPILTSKAKKRVYKKSTQGGMSECLIIISWTKAQSGRIVFYILPTDGLKNRFVSNRWEKSMAFTPYYRRKKIENRSKDFRVQIIDNKSLKDIGPGVINFAGSKSEIPFIEIPADDIIVDEADKCDVKQLEMALERLGHSTDPQELYAGNPTFIGSFLDVKYDESTKERWNIKADCGHWIDIDFFNHVVRQVDEHDFVIRDPDFEFYSGNDIRPICAECDKPFNRFNPGEYVIEKQSDIEGKHISRLYSGTSTLLNVVDNFTKGLENDYKMQRFYNSDLGESYTAEGSKITAKLIEANKREYNMPSSSQQPCIMGADVGNQIHVRINRLLNGGIKQAVYIGTVETLAQLLSLVKLYNVIGAVIDALPEIRLSRSFSHSFTGAFRCFFGADKHDTVNLQEKEIHVSRTASMDEMKEKIVKGEIIFPRNILSIEEYMKHMQEPTRTFDEEAGENGEYIWVSNRPDHYFLAETYCSLAEKILIHLK